MNRPSAGSPPPISRSRRPAVAHASSHRDLDDPGRNEASPHPARNDVSRRPLGDAPGRDYAGELAAFEDFAAPELRRIVADLSPGTGDRILDVGCGTGGATRLLTGEGRRVVGADLSMPHARRAAHRAGEARIVVADAARPPFPDEAFDLLWACNALNHLSDPVAGLRRLTRALRPGGRVAVVQSHLLPEMFFAWDYHFDARVRAACHAFYREEYDLRPSDTAHVTRLFGVVRDAGLEGVRPTTYVVERHAPLSEEDRRYLSGAFDRYWGEKLAPFLEPDDRTRLRRLTDPDSPEFCLDRDDFHHIQTLTVVTGSRARG